SASGMSRTGMLMLRTPMAAWIASSTVCRFRSMCLRSATPYTTVDRPTARYGATGAGGPFDFPSEALVGRRRPDPDFLPGIDPPRNVGVPEATPSPCPVGADVASVDRLGAKYLPGRMGDAHVHGRRSVREAPPGRTSVRRRRRAN